MSFYPRSNLKKNLATTSLLIWQFAAFCGTANAIDTSDPERKESNSVSRLVNRPVSYTHLTLPTIYSV